MENAFREAMAAVPRITGQYQTYSDGTKSKYLLTISYPYIGDLPVAETDRGSSSTPSPQKYLESVQRQPQPAKTGSQLERFLTVLGNHGVEVSQIELLDSKVSASRFTSSLLLLLASLIALLIYFVAIEPIITDRFEVSISIDLGLLSRLLIAAGIVGSAIHDVVVMLIVCTVAHIDLGLSAIAALLTVIGYSVMDSIVIWNYVRKEANRLTRRRSLSFDTSIIVQRAVDASFSRVVLTSASTMIPVLAILFAGLSPLRDFAILIGAGTISGTISSVFVVGPFAAKALRFATRPSIVFNDGTAQDHPQFETLTASVGTVAWLTKQPGTPPPHSLPRNGETVLDIVAKQIDAVE